MKQFTIPLTASEIKHFTISLELIKRIQVTFSYHVYLVGGACRDLMQNFFFRKDKIVHDLDFAIFKDNGEGLSKEELIELMEFILLDRKYSVVDETDFLHLKVIENNSHFEIEFTSFRKETYRDTRKPETVGGTLESDIERRDFTVNAIYLKIFDLREHSVILESDIEISEQYIEDVKNQILKTTTEDPMDVFLEDPLRIMRAIRFKGYGFELDDKIKNAIEDFPMDIFFQKVSKERISMELLTILERGDVDFLILLGFIQKIIPQFEDFIGTPYEKDELTHIVSVIKKVRELKVSNERKKIFLLSALFHDIGKAKTGQYSEKKERFQFLGHEHISAEIAKDWLIKFKFSKRIINGVYHLISEHMTTKFFNKTPLKSIVRWILLYLDKNKFPDLIENVLIFNTLDWGGKSKDWRIKNAHLIQDEQKVADMVRELVIFIDEFKEDKKEEFQRISKEIGEDKHIPIPSKKKAINKRHANLIVGEFRKLKKVDF